MSEKEDKKLPKPSDEFMDAVCNSGSIHIMCEFCGRTHFVDEHWGDFEEGEFEDLIKKNKENPDKYIYHDEGSVSFGYLDEIQVVFDCPCNMASKYEQLFWKSRNIIRNYFNKKAKKIQEIARDETGLAKDVDDALNSLE